MLRTPHLIMALAMALTAALAEPADAMPTHDKGATQTVEVVARGYDVVAFFNEDKAVKGDETIMLDHDGKRYFFDNADNKAAFLANPERYIPQYGGYCAFALARGTKKKGTPEAFAVVGDKLYFTASPSVRNRWEQEADNNIKRANENWTEDGTKNVSP